MDCACGCDRTLTPENAAVSAAAFEILALTTTTRFLDTDWIHDDLVGTGHHYATVLFDAAHGHVSAEPQFTRDQLAEWKAAATTVVQENIYRLLNRDNPIWAGSISEPDNTPIPTENPERIAPASSPSSGNASGMILMEDNAAGSVPAPVPVTDEQPGTPEPQDESQEPDIVAAETPAPDPDPEPTGTDTGTTAEAAPEPETETFEESIKAALRSDPTVLAIGDSPVPTAGPTEDDAPAGGQPSDNDQTDSEDEPLRSEPVSTLPPPPPPPTQTAMPSWVTTPEIVEIPEPAPLPREPEGFFLDDDVPANPSPVTFDLPDEPDESTKKKKRFWSAKRSA